MSYKKEHPAVIVISVFAAIFFTISLTATLIMLPIHLSLKTITSADTYIKSNGFTSELTEAVNNSIRNSLQSLNPDLNISGDCFSEDFVESIVKNVFDAGAKGKAIDADPLVNEYRNAFTKYLSNSRADIEELVNYVDIFSDNFSDTLNHFSNRFTSEPTLFTDPFRLFLDMIKSLTIILLIAITVTALLIILIYKKKFCAMRIFGISGTVAGCLGFIFSIYISQFINTIVTELETENTTNTDTIQHLFADVAVKELSHLPTSLMFSCVLCLIAGIVLIILSCIIGRNYKKSCMQATSSYSSDNTYQEAEF